MAGEQETAWQPGAPPYDDGRVVLVIVKGDGTRSAGGHEYYGKPVTVVCWGSKLKTTYDSLRIDLEDVERWMDLPPPPDPHRKG